MNQNFNISGPTSLGLHTMGILASRTDGETQTVRDIARTLGACEAHRAKVMQKLARAGLVNPRRGPGGGFVLGRAKSDISLLDIFAALEGSLNLKACLLRSNICIGKSCLSGDMPEKMGLEFKRHMSDTYLSDLQTTYGTES